MEGRGSLALMLLVAGIVGLLTSDSVEHPAAASTFPADPAEHRVSTPDPGARFAFLAREPASGMVCGGFAGGWCQPRCIGDSCAAVCQLAHHATPALPAA